MLPGRLERALTLAILLVTACTVLPTARTPAHAETRRVAIPGQEADTLAETTSAVEDGLVQVHTHDGRELWVRDGSLGGASLVPGTWVLMRQSGAPPLVVAITRSFDDFIEVALVGTPTLVPVSDVLARLHHGPATAPVVPPPPPVVSPPPPTPTPLGQMAALEAVQSMRVGQLVSCTEGTARVLFTDGTDTTVATSALHPLHVRTGDHVMALWGDSPYPATIVGAEGTLVHAHWDDGDDRWIENTGVVAVDGAATGAVRGCPHRRVLVDEGARTRVGHVLACEGGMATVLDASGMPQQLTRETLARVPLRVGDRIEANWNGSPYEATVMAMGERLHVRWSDGSEGEVDPADLLSYRAHEARPVEPVSCPDV